MIKYGITGNIACGKSVTFEIIKAEGYTIIDCDDIIKKYYSQKDFIIETEKIFPQIVSNGKINLKILSGLLFNDNDFKEKYETFIFPKVEEKIIDFFKQEIEQEKVFVVVPMLFEAGFENLFDKIIFIQSDENIRKQRLIKRKSTLSDFAENVIKSQISEDKKIPRCNYVIKNNGTLDEFKNTVNTLLNNI